MAREAAHKLTASQGHRKSEKELSIPQKTRRSSGEGSISRRSDGRWQASIQVDGKRRTVYGRTRQDVVRKLDDLKRQAHAAGILPDPGSRTLNDLLDAWLETKSPNVRPRTLADYADTCDRYLRPTLGKNPLSKVTPDRVARLYGRWQKQGKAKTALKCHRTLSQALALAVRWGWLGSNPCDRVDTPRYQPERKELWTAEQLRRFLDGTREHWLGSLWTFLAYSGCRLGEALALTWSDVDLASGRILIAKSVQCISGERVTTGPKTRAGMRVITLPGVAIESLLSQAEASLARSIHSSVSGSLVFANTKGEPLSQGAAAWHMRQACKLLGLPA